MSCDTWRFLLKMKKRVVVSFAETVHDNGIDNELLRTVCS